MVECTPSAVWAAEVVEGKSTYWPGLGGSPLMRRTILHKTPKSLRSKFVGKAAGSYKVAVWNLSVCPSRQLEFEEAWAAERRHMDAWAAKASPAEAAAAQALAAVASAAGGAPAIN